MPDTQLDSLGSVPRTQEALPSESANGSLPADGSSPANGFDNAPINWTNMILFTATPLLAVTLVPA